MTTTQTRPISHLYRLRDSGIGGTENERLALLTMYDDGPHAMGGLCEKIGLSRAAMTALADRLAANGLIDRVPDIDDRRVTHLELTPYATACVAGALEAVPA